MSSVWSTEPQLKKCLRDTETALKIFEGELLCDCDVNLEQIKEHGLFFSFTTDPMLESTYWLTMSAVNICLANDVPVKILTKCTRKILSVFFGNSVYKDYYKEKKHLIAIGFTLTGHDELEPNASTNQERIEVMKMLHDEGYKTFASIEPIIDFDSSLKMIQQTAKFCNLFKIGLMGNKKYRTEMMKLFFEDVCSLASINGFKVYFKDSLLNQLDVDRILLSNYCVTRDYNLFKQK